MVLPRITAAMVASAFATWAGCAHAADEPVELAPSSPWEVDYAEDSCALRRTFQSGEHKGFLELRQYGPGEHFELLVVSDTVPRKERTPRVRFEPDAEWHEPAGARLASNSAGSGVLFQDSLRPRRSVETEWGESERDSRERAVVALTVAETFEPALALRTGSMQRPMAAMRTCLQDLVSPQGVDAGPPGPVARGPTPVGLQEWARRIQAYYPQRMAWMGKGARISVRLVIGKDGRVRSCFADGSHEQDFLDTACVALMQFARFDPAIDASGGPAIGTYSTIIVYSTD